MAASPACVCRATYTRWPDGENTSARGWSASATNVASRRPSGSMRTTPESAATPTRSPQRVAATGLPAGSGRLVAGWSGAAVMSFAESTAMSRRSAAPNSWRGTLGSGCGHATRTRRPTETTCRFTSTAYSVPSGPTVARSIPVATVSTRALPKSSPNTSCFDVATYRNPASGSSPTTRSSGGSFPRSAPGISTRPAGRYTRGDPPLAGTRIATPAVRAEPAASLLTVCLTCGCDDAAAGTRDRQPHSARLARRRKDPRVRKRASPDKIDNRRGQDKCFSGAELEGRPHTHRPVGRVARAAQRLGNVESQHDEAQDVDPDRAPPALDRRAELLEVLLIRRPIPHDGGVRAPGQSHVVEQRPLDRRQTHREKAEDQTAGEREAQLDVRHGEARADQLVKRGAPRLPRRARGLREALVVEQRARRVAPHHVRVPEELREQVAVASEAPEEHASDGECERPRKEITAPVGDAGREPPRAPIRTDLEPRARAGKRPDEPEQRIVVHQRDLGAIVANRRPVGGDGRVDPHQATALKEIVLAEDGLADAREMEAQFHPREAIERIEPLRERVADHEPLDLA